MFLCHHLLTRWHIYLVQKTKWRKRRAWFPGCCLHFSSFPFYPAVMAAFSCRAHPCKGFKMQTQINATLPLSWPPYTQAATLCLFFCHLLFPWRSCLPFLGDCTGLWGCNRLYLAGSASLGHLVFSDAPCHPCTCHFYTCTHLSVGHILRVKSQT
jgi:hypothetical protein